MQNLPCCLQGVIPSWWRVTQPGELLLTPPGSQQSVNDVGQGGLLVCVWEQKFQGLAVPELGLWLCRGCWGRASSVGSGGARWGEEEDLGIAGSVGLTAAGGWWGCWVAVTGQGPAMLAPAVPEED